MRTSLSGETEIAQNEGHKKKLLAPPTPWFSSNPCQQRPLAATNGASHSVRVLLPLPSLSLAVVVNVAINAWVMRARRLHAYSGHSVCRGYEFSYVPRVPSPREESSANISSAPYTQTLNRALVQADVRPYGDQRKCTLATEPEQLASPSVVPRPWKLTGRFSSPSDRPSWLAGRARSPRKYAQLYSSEENSFPSSSSSSRALSLSRSLSRATGGQLHVCQ